MRHNKNLKLENVGSSKVIAGSIPVASHFLFDSSTCPDPCSSSTTTVEVPADSICSGMKSHTNISSKNKQEWS